MVAAIDNDFAVATEKRDRLLFQRWCTMTGCFSWTGSTGKGDAYDVKGMLRDGRECMVELKYRDVAHDKYDDVMIEADKLADGLMYWHLSGLTPLYICLYNDGWTGVFNLTTISQPRKDKVRRKNPGVDNRLVESATYFLSAMDGVFYDDGGRVYK